MSTRAQRINSLLQKLTPVFLEVIDESNRHHVPENAQTHFKVIISCENFTGMRLLQRHQAINQLLQSEFDSGMHALSIHAYTPDEWEKKNKKAPKSPGCRDGYDVN